MLCILYVNFMGLLLGIVGSAAERGLPAAVSRRWIWVIVMVASLAVPGYYSVNHTVTVADVLGGRSAVAATSPTAGSLSPLDAEWWVHLQSLDPLINVGWKGASLLLLIWGLASVWRVSLLVRRAGGLRRPTSVDGMPVLVTDAAGPATVGLLRSRVLVPRWVLALPGKERRYVLRHEDEHRKAHDAQLLFAASLLLVLIPWNLALWWQLRRLRLAVELDCDNRVVAALGDAPAYGALLFRVAEASNRGPRLQPAFLGGAGMLETRLRKLVAPGARSWVQRLVLPAFALVLLAMVLTIPHPVVSAESHAAHLADGATAAASHR